MKKTLLFCGLFTFLFSSCKKDQATSDHKEDFVNPSDAKALTAAVTVYHSVKINGNPPAPSAASSAPVLDPASDNQQINALNGRYVVIKPEVASGAVAGYYLKITGSDTYYKIDFTKPRTPANRIAGNTNSKHTIFSHRERGYSTNRTDSSAEPGYADSSIIIQLPANIGPGTFCAEYWAYDYQNQVSNTIKVCVTIDQLGGGADGGGFVGSWKETMEKFYDNPQDTGWHILTYQKEYSPAQEYYCYNNMLSYYPDSSLGSNPVITPASYSYDWTKQEDLIFALNGGVQLLADNEHGSLDLAVSSCSNFVYHTDWADKTQDTGGWSYNNTTKKLVFVFDFDGSGAEDPQGFEFIVTDKTTDRLILYNETDKAGYEFRKK